jgi:hypothetical protein
MTPAAIGCFQQPKPANSLDWEPLMRQSFLAFQIGLTVVASSVAMLPLQAEAASVAGKTFSFYGSAQLQNAGAGTGGFSVLDFSQGGDPGVPVGLGQASIAEASDIGNYNQQFTIRDLQLTKTGAKTWTLATLLGDLNQLGGGLATNTWFNTANISYALTGFDLKQADDGDFDAVISGIFSPDGLGTQDGTFSSQFRLSSKKTSYSADITAVPTPMLLPGLIGMGISLVRKRRTQASSTAGV